MKEKVVVECNASYSVKQAFEEYNKAKKVLSEVLDHEIIYDVQLHNMYWTYNYGEFNWQEDEEYYSEDAKLIKEVQDYTLFLIYNCFGEKCYLLAENSKRLG